MDEEQRAVKRHLWIAGTGRAGTSFLVRYLTELGLDTHLARFGEHAAWDEEANAGLENPPLPGLDDSLPYVVKSPWLYQFIDTLLSNRVMAADTVIVPVRDLAEAAVSRSIIERRAIHQQAPWMTQCDRPWEEWGHVPGGVTYSLNPIDQGRLLAVGFHHLVQRLVAADIPIIFLAFPRFIEDAAYLYDKLQPVLPWGLDHQRAQAAHQRLADRAQVRVRREVGTASLGGIVTDASGMGHGLDEALDTIAVRRELARLRKQLAGIQSALEDAEERSRMAHAAAAMQETVLRDRIAVMEHAVTAATADAVRARQQKTEIARASDEAIERCQQQVHRLTEDVRMLRQEAVFEAERTQTLHEALAAIQVSRSWRITRPYRTVGLALRRALRR